MVILNIKNFANPVKHLVKHVQVKRNVARVFHPSIHLTTPALSYVHLVSIKVQTIPHVFHVMHFQLVAMLVTKQCVMIVRKTFFLKEGKCVKKCDLGFFAVNATCLQCTLNHSNCSQCNITTCFECEAKFKLINNVCNEECDTGSKKINGTCKLCVSPTCSENAEIILVEKEREDIQVIPLKSEITVEEEEAKQFDHTSKLVESLQETLANFTRNTKLVEAEFSNNKRSKRSIELENTNSNDHYKTNISFLSKMITILACFVSVAFILFIAWRSKGFFGKLIRGKRSLVLHYNTTEEIWTENKP